VTKVSLQKIPPYPYGPNRWYKQANRGLYGGGVIQFGNKISQGKNEGKTRRTWSPNVDVEKLWSDTLQKELTIKVRHRVLRTIKKVGGLDNYLLGEKPARIRELGVYGWKLRWLVMNAPSMRERFKEEKKMLELPAKGENWDTYWKQRGREMVEERAQWLNEVEEERRARERSLEDEEEFLDDYEDGDLSEEERSQIQTEPAAIDGDGKPEGDARGRFMQEQVPVKEK
jgi:large subunit ribosomal protein L28